MTTRLKITERIDVALKGRFSTKKASVLRRAINAGRLQSIGISRIASDEWRVRRGELLKFEGVIRKKGPI